MATIQDIDVTLLPLPKSAFDSVLDRPRTVEETIALLKQKHPNILWPTLSDYAELKREASERALRIFGDWNGLHDILERHENTFRRRWTRKTIDQRKKILLAAWPDMPAAHRPDIKAMYRETRKQREEATRFRDAFLFPCINLEDLAGARPLLLLNARGHNLPHVFAENDLKSARVGLNCGAISLGLLYGYKMMLEAQTTPQTYGQLCSYEENINGMSVYPGLGILVLEIQQRLLSFLKLCTELILHDISLHDMTIPTQPPAPLDQNSWWPSLARSLAEPPYNLPDPCDFQYLEALLHAKRAEAMDYMWSLREDPGYFREMVHDWSEHRDEIFFSAEGKRQPMYREVIEWDMTARDVIASAYRDLLLWNLALAHFSELRAIGARDGRLTLDNKRMVEASRIEYAHFSYLVTRMQIFSLGDLKAGIFASPAIRVDYEWAPGGSDTTDSRIVRRCTKRRDYLLDLIDAITDWTMVSRWGLHNILDELERVLQSDGKQRKRISTWVTRFISDLTIAAELERQMSLYQPEAWAKIFYQGLTEELMLDEYLRRTPWVTIVMQGMKKMRLAEGVSFLRKCGYPSDKPRTAQRTREMIEAETALDAVWNRVDEEFVELTEEKELHDFLRIIFPKAEWTRELRRTPEWSQPVLQTTQGRSPVQATHDAFPALDLENRTRRKISTSKATPAKAKVKTRGQATESAEAAIEAEAPTPPTTPLTISVHKRAYKTFTAFFHTSDKDELPGEISWLDFLQAMSSAGFAVEKLDGSAWMFKPQNDVQRGIIFHEPHPHSKIPLSIARRHGRR